MPEAEEAVVFVLQGCASLPPQSWKARTLRRPASTALDAARVAAVRNPSRSAVLGVVVRGMGLLFDEEPQRRKEEARLRAAVLRTRGVLFQLLKEGRLQQSPLIFEVAAEDIVPRGAMGRAIERRLEELIETREGEERGEAVGDGHGEQHHATLPKAPKRIQVVGRERWMGKAVLRREAAGLHEALPRARRPSKLVIDELRLQRAERHHVHLPIIRKEDGATFKLPGARTGKSPWGVSDDCDSDLGSVFAIECAEYWDAEEGSATLRVSGNASEDIVASAHVARTFIKLHRGWISAWLGKGVVRDPATANVVLHLCSAAIAREGVSLGANFTVCLVSHYWDVEVAHNRLVITGEATLSGPVGSVGGLRGKLLAAYRQLIVAGSGSNFVVGSACVIVPSDNTYTGGTSGVLVENPSAFDGRAMVKVDVPNGVKARLSVYAAPTLFDVIALAFSPQAPAAPPHLVQRPPVPTEHLAVVKTFMCFAQGGFPQVIECALLSGGTGKRKYTHDVKAGMKDAIEAGLNWLATRWEEDSLADYAAVAGTAATTSKPADRDYDLHFNIPGAANVLEDEAYVSCSALVAVLSLFLRRPVPDDVVVLAECRLDGSLQAPTFPAPLSMSTLSETVLSLAKANGVTRVLTTGHAARQLHGLSQQHRRWKGVEVVAVASVVDVICATWDINREFGTRRACGEPRSCLCAFFVVLSS